MDRDDVEERLLALVAFDPDLVTRANVLLDDLALLGIDSSRASSARAEKRATERARVTVREEVLTGWADSLPPDVALAQATALLRSFALRGPDAPDPKQATVDKATGRLAVAVDAVVRRRIDTSEPVEALRRRIVDLLRAQAKSAKRSATAHALNNAADKVRGLAFEERPAMPPDGPQGQA